MVKPAENAARIRQLSRFMFQDLAVVVTRSQQTLYDDSGDSLPSTGLTGDYRRKFAKVRSHVMNIIFTSNTGTIGFYFFCKVAHIHNMITKCLQLMLFG